MADFKFPPRPPRPSFLKFPPELPKLSIPKISRVLQPATDAINASHDVLQTMTEGIHTLATAMRTPITTSVKVVAKAVEDAAERQAEEIDKPSTEETITMLEARINESLVALQPDLLDGARINGKSCDCLRKHTDEMLAAVRELQSMASKPVYARIRAWCQKYNWPAEEVAKHSPEYFVALAPQVRALRKELSGSEPSQAAKEAEEPDCPRCEKIKTATEFLREQRLKKAREAEGDKK